MQGPDRHKHWVQAAWALRRQMHRGRHAGRFKPRAYTAVAAGHVYVSVARAHLGCTSYQVPAALCECVLERLFLQGCRQARTAAQSDDGHCVCHTLMPFTTTLQIKDSAPIRSITFARM